MENRIKGGRNGERIALEENTREGAGKGEEAERGKENNLAAPRE